MSNKKEFLPFKEAREVVHRFGITSSKEWYHMRIWRVRSLAIPSNPYQHYKNKGWVCWEHFLRATPKFKTFEEAREIARKLSIFSSLEWRTSKYTLHMGLGIPSCPERTYAKSGWRGWKDFLGTYK